MSESELTKLNGSAEDAILKKNKLKFCRDTFFIDLLSLITSKEFIAWAFYAILTVCSVFTVNSLLAQHFDRLFLWLGIITIIFILKKCLEKVLEIVATNTKINGEIKLGKSVETKIAGDLKDIITEAVEKIKK